MSGISQYLNRPLNVRQTAVIILLAGGLAALGYAACKLISAGLLQARISKMVPKVCEEIRGQRAKLVSAIEGYKAQFGAFPPDHVISRQPLVVDPITNTLLYELAGVIYDPTNKTFQVDSQEAAEASFVRQFFQCEGFKNCSERSDQVKRFLPSDPLPAIQLHDDPDTFALGFPLYSVQSVNLDPEASFQMRVTPWRYIASSPTNNPGRFDLWIELQTRTRKIIIGNWKAVE